MKKIVLVGNPNVGKSLLFSRITKTGAIASNYAGTTVELNAGHFIYNGTGYEIIDGPGVYSLEEFSKADKTALKLIEDGDILINVVDSTSLERNLGLTLQLLDRGKPVVICLNLWEETEHKGISIDTAELEKLLDVPVVTVSALRGEGISALLAALDRAKPGRKTDDTAAPWLRIGEILEKTQKLTHRHHTPLEYLSDFTLHPLGGPFSAVLVLLATLLTVRFMGEGLADHLLEPLYSRLYSPFMVNIVNYIPFQIIKGLLIGYNPDPLQSFGILTSGVYIALVLVLPYFFSFYLVFGFLEDFGYLPRLAVVLDNIFHKLGLHGYSAIPVMLGLGCKVPAFLATRMLTDKREKMLTITLIFMSAPCLPQTSMIISLGMGYGIPVVIAIFAILLLIAFITNFALNKLLKGDLPDFFTELPSYRIPSGRLLAKKLWIRMSEYFVEVLPMIAVGVLIMNALEAFNITAFVTEIIKKPVALLFGLPADIAPIMLLGFLRKDVSIALLSPLHLSSYQFIIGSILLSLYTPCVASFFTLIKEVGTWSAFKIAGLVFMCATMAAALLHVIFDLLS